MATSPRVLVIGGGLLGALCALRLRDAGAGVVLLDRGTPGNEATFAAAGILAAQSEAAGEGALFGLGVASRELHRSLSRELLDRIGREGALCHSGVLELCLSEARMEVVYDRARWQLALGHKVERLSARELFAREPGLRDDLVGAVLFEDDGVLDPRALHEAVLSLARREGVEVVCDREVSGLIVRSGRARGVDLEGEAVEGDAVVLCAGARSGAVKHCEILENTVIPARGQMVELRAKGVEGRGPSPELGAVLFTSDGYLVPRADGRVLAGSTLEFVGFDPRVTAEGVQKLLGMATATVPRLARASFVSAWAGLRPYSVDGLPFIGKSSVEGLFVATGHHRSGILLGPVTAEIVRDLVMFGETGYSIEEFSPTRKASLRS